MIKVNISLLANQHGRRGMFIVCRLEQFDLEPSPNRILRIPFEIKIDTKMVGFLPVYETREDALSDYPNAELMEIRFKA